MTKRSALLVALAALALGACNRLPESEGVRLSREITLSGDIGAFTKVASGAFEANDVAGLFVGAPVNVTNVKITSDGQGGFTPSEKLYWGAEQKDDEASTFVAYYPWQEAAALGQSLSYALKTDQTTAGAYEASDFLYATVTSTPADESVSLPFKHLLSRFVITVECMVDGHSITAVTVDGVKMTADIQLDNGAVAASGDATQAKAAVADGSFLLVLPPQTASPEIILTVSNGEQVSFVPANQLTFASGKQMRASLVLDMDTITAFEATEEDWATEVVELAPARPEPGTHTWSVYMPDSKTYYPMEATEDGLFTVRLYGYNRDGFLICMDEKEDRYFGNTRNNVWSTIKEPTQLALVSAKTTYRIWVNTTLDLVVTLDVAKMQASFAEVPHEWEAMGEGLFIDGFICPLLGYGEEEVAVQCEKDKNYEGTYRILNPYENSYWVQLSQWSYKAAYFMLVVKEDGHAYIPTFHTGLTHSRYGAFYGVTPVPEADFGGYDLYGSFDKENLTVHFQEKTLTYYNGGQKNSWSNDYGMLHITLPGGTRQVVFNEVSISELNSPTPQNTEMTFEGKVQLDVQSAVFGVWEGNLSDEEIATTCIPALKTEGTPVEGLEEDKLFGGKWTCEKSGDYTLIVLATDKNGGYSYASYSFTAKLEVNSDYSSWLGNWNIGDRVYSIEKGKENVSYVVRGFDVVESVVLYYDAESGDAFFACGEQSRYMENNEEHIIYLTGLVGNSLYYIQGDMIARLVYGNDGISASMQSGLYGYDSLALLSYSVSQGSWFLTTKENIIGPMPLEITKVTESNMAPKPITQSRIQKSVSLSPAVIFQK